MKTVWWGIIPSKKFERRIATWIDTEPTSLKVALDYANETYARPGSTMLDMIYYMPHL